MLFPLATVSLPLGWVEEVLSNPGREYSTEEDRMRLVIELVASTEPCAMCFGAISWSGVRRLVCGAREEDARRIRFDEGPKVSDWVAALEQRGISVARDVCRDEAAAVLRYYIESGGTLYNARQGA